MVESYSATFSYYKNNTFTCDDVTPVVIVLRDFACFSNRVFETTFNGLAIKQHSLNYYLVHRCVGNFAIRLERVFLVFTLAEEYIIGNNINVILIQPQVQLLYIS